MGVNSLVWADKINSRLIVVYVSKDSSKFIGRTKKGNYHKGYLKDLSLIRE